MNRLVAILLMPLFVVGNSLAHSHGTATHQSQGEGRAHFHVGNDQKQGHHNHDSHEHVHHEHDHENVKPESAPVAPLEHDSDAVYVVAADFVCNACDRVSLEIESQAFVCAEIFPQADFRPTVLRNRPPLATTAQLPLYLLHAALRL